SSYDHNKSELIRLQRQKAEAVAFTISQFFDQATTTLEAVKGAGLTATQLVLELQPLLGIHTTGVFYIDPSGAKTTVTPGQAPQRTRTKPHQRFFELTRARGEFYGQPFGGDLTICT